MTHHIIQSEPTHPAICSNPPTPRTLNECGFHLLPSFCSDTEDVFYIGADIVSPTYSIVRFDRIHGGAICSCGVLCCAHVEMIRREYYQPMNVQFITIDNLLEVNDCDDCIDDEPPFIEWGERYGMPGCF